MPLRDDPARIVERAGFERLPPTMLMPPMDQAGSAIAAKQAIKRVARLRRARQDGGLTLREPQVIERNGHGKPEGAAALFAAQAAMAGPDAQRWRAQFIAHGTALASARLRKDWLGEG